MNTGPIASPTALAALVIVVGAALRFYGLGHGLPFHFHADEMLALRGAEMLRESPHAAAQSAKFFVYPVLPKEVLALLANAYEALIQPLDMAKKDDGRVLMLLGRAVSATASTLTLPIVFLIGRRAGGAMAGLVAVGLAATAVIAIAHAHFFTSDAMLTLFCAVALLGCVQVADHGRRSAYLLAGVGIGLALASKYTAAFLLLPLATAHWLVRPASRAQAQRPGWSRWLLSGLMALLVAGGVFLLVNPLIVQHWQKFLSDLRIVELNFSSEGPIWTAQFADVWLRPYWFTNLLPWNLGPAFAIWALAGSAWLIYQRERIGLTIASYLVFYFAIASQTTTPFVRYLLPAVPALAVAAGVLSADLLSRQGGWGRVGRVGTAIVVLATSLWGLAYMNVYHQEDVRVQAARFIDIRFPETARVLVEPSHNIPPMGSYRDDTQFFTDYVLWGPTAVRKDRYLLHGLDVYRHLYDTTIGPDAKRQYIRERLALVDYIVMDDTFEEFYEHLDGPEHAPVREYYRDLFTGRLEFVLMRRFKVFPGLFGVSIPDERAEMTFSLFDHPTIYVFMRHRDSKTGPSAAPPRPRRIVSRDRAAARPPRPDSGPRRVTVQRRRRARDRHSVGV